MLHRSLNKFLSSQIWFLIKWRKSAAIWNVKPSITKGPLGMTGQWTRMRSNPNCRILTGYEDSTRSRRSRPKGVPPTLGTETSKFYQEERKSTETPLVAASERGQATSVKPATPELRQPLTWRRPKDAPPVCPGEPSRRGWQTHSFGPSRLR